MTTVSKNEGLNQKIANLRKRLGIKSPAKKTELIEARHAFANLILWSGSSKVINRESLIGKKRYCSCCDSEYTEWKEQDLEGYRCQRCTARSLRREVREYQKGVELLCSVLSPENSSQLRSMPFYMQRMMVDSAHEEGILSY